MLRLIEIEGVRVWGSIPTMASATCPTSPLVLDLNGDGIQTTDLFSPVSFDLNGDGIISEDDLIWLKIELQAIRTELCSLGQHSVDPEGVGEE